QSVTLHQVNRKIKGKKECIMARTTLQRRVPNTAVKYALVNTDSGSLSETKEVRFEGKLSEAQAYGKLMEVETDKFTVIDVEVHNTLYKMPISDFIKYAEEVEENKGTGEQ